MSQVSRRVTTVAWLGLLTVAIAFGGGSVAYASMSPTDSEVEDVVVGSTDELTLSELDLLESDALKRVVVNPLTGDITDVFPMTSGELQTRQSLASGSAVSPMGVSVGCTSTSPCWYGRPPAVHYRFTIGVTDGTWTNRADFWTGNYYAKLCWLDPQTPFNPATVCMPLRNGNNAWIQLGYYVTGKQVDLATTRG